MSLRTSSTEPDENDLVPIHIVRSNVGVNLADILPIRLVSVEHTGTQSTNLCDANTEGTAEDLVGFCGCRTNAGVIIDSLEGPVGTDVL